MDKPARTFGVSDAALAQVKAHGKRSAGPQFNTAADTYRAAVPLPGVIPDTIEADTARAYDDVNGLYGSMGSFGIGERLGFLGMPYLSELTQRPEYRKGSEIIAKTMTRKWIRLTVTGEQDKTDKLKALTEAMVRLRVQETFCRIAEHDGFFGRGHLYIDTGATEDPAELATPLFVHKAKIEKGAPIAFRTVEPIWTYPANYDISNPLHQDFYKPRAWYVQGRTVHRSRLLTFVGRAVPDILKPAYSFGGISLSQLSKPYVDNWLRTRQSVSDIIHSFSTPVLMTNMADALNQGSAGAMMTRLALYAAVHDNQGLFAIDKTYEDFKNVSAPLGTLDALQAQSQEQMASVLGIPLVVLLGITPSGLNASTDGELRSFYDWVGAQQHHLFGTHLTTVLKIIQMSEFGEVDPAIGFEFEPLWQMDDAALAAIRKTDMDSDIEAVTAGVLAPIEVRTRLAADKSSPYAGLDVDDVPEAPADESGGAIDDPESNKIDEEGEKVGGGVSGV